MNDILDIILSAIADDAIEVKKATPMECTIPDMLSDNYKDRLRAEFKQCVIRQVHLERRIADKEKTVNDLSLMEEQLKIMKAYTDILRKRMVNEGIEI